MDGSRLLLVHRACRPIHASGRLSDPPLGDLAALLRRSFFVLAALRRYGPSQILLRGADAEQHHSTPRTRRASPAGFNLRSYGGRVSREARPSRDGASPVASGRLVIRSTAPATTTANGECRSVYGRHGYFEKVCRFEDRSAG